MMATLDQIALSAVMAGIAVGYFCLGWLWKARKDMEIWHRGFDAAERIYKQSSIKEPTP